MKKIRNLLKQSSTKIFLLIFLTAIFLRFLFFPGNIYFGYDQARDAFSAAEIATGELKLLGPTTSYEGLHHGVLYEYLITPLYFFGQGNPMMLSIFIRIMNGLGVFLIFFTSLILFRKELNKSKTILISILSALFYAFSFEQNQFSIYMGNPSLASLSVVAMYLGLGLVIFERFKYGLILAAFALGVSIQFEFALIYLIVPFTFLLIFFYKTFLKIPLKIITLSIIAFLLSISTFIVAELKFDFRSTKVLLGGDNFSERHLSIISNSFFDAVLSIIRLNFLGELPFKNIGVILIIVGVFFLIKRGLFKKQLLFLGVWFFSLFSTFLISGGRSSGEALFYTNVGVSQSLIISVSLILVFFLNRKKIVLTGIVLFILITNIYQIIKYNPYGTITAINVQQEMLLENQKIVLDLIYKDANGKQFAVKAITIPALINTTWSYLFEWHGKNKYGYVPIWGDKNAIGYSGNLKVIDAQHQLPKDRYVIIEPPSGMKKEYIDEYFRIEGYFTDIEWEKKIGSFRIQKRTPKD